MGKSKTFAKVVLCHTDDFPAKKNDKIKGWVEAHGGTFSKTLTPHVTHLVCSKRAWKEYLPLGECCLACIPLRRHSPRPIIPFAKRPQYEKRVARE